MAEITEAKIMENVAEQIRKIDIQEVKYWCENKAPEQDPVKVMWKICILICWGFSEEAIEDMFGPVFYRL